ncbi:MAG: glycosyltransferase family 4 protein [Gammaproteobacteria bacterium]|nr:glycosyltransferase family 4 protein [Gammaproteobacteria bacterium]MBU2158118.1 glycosyltransferase family 4 protein [Gammaproteobacteria bacterium]MBU2255740.1 glycosyltransferase family 4 protein [Gammaproteobacteria bacterium]MBU2295350.1 glycosyltransferase family 4 protein [Gammaproteobacteria bacterium]
MRVLYLHPAGAFGGASKSLIELYRQLAGRGVKGTVVTPSGSAQGPFAAAGLDVRAVRGLSQFDNTRYGFYRRLRWIILLRELFLLPFSLWALWRMRCEGFDLIHVNELTLLPLGILAKRLWRVPLVVHVRSLQRKPGEGRRTRWLHALLRRHADAVVAIDHTVAATLGADLSLSVIHNGLSVEATVPSVSQTSQDRPVQVGFLGVLIELKGIFELLQAMRILKQRGVNIRCLVAGENARELSGLKAWVLARLGFGRDVRAELEALIERHELHEQVELLGFVADVRTLYPALDILCFPSHLDAAGRPVFEAAFYSIPSVVAVANPVEDAIVHEVTGLAVPTPDPVLIADALQRLVEDTLLRSQLGQQAKIWAERTFDIGANAARMHALYSQLLSSNPGR